MNVKERFCAISWMKDHRKMCICKMIQISQTHLSMVGTWLGKYIGGGGGGYSTCNTYASWFKESWVAGIGWYYTTLIWIMSCLSVSHLSHCLLLLNPMREALISAKHYLLSKVWFDLTLKSSLELSTRRSIQWSSLRYLVSILALFFRLVFLYP